MSGILQGLIASISSAAAAVTDTYFNLVTLLLNTTTTNGAQNNTFIDSSTNNFTITRNGNTTQGTFTPFSQTGWSNYFGGTSDYLSTGTSLYNYTTANASTQTATFEALVYTTAYGSPSQTYYSESIVSKGDVYMNFGINGSGNLVLAHYDGTQRSVISTGTIPLNTWTYVACTISGGVVTLYINGSSSGTGTWYGIAAGGQNSASQIGLAGGTGSGGVFFKGYISNVRISSTVRTISTPTIAYSNDANTSLLTCQSNRFVDNSTNAYSVTVNGTPSVQAFSPFAPTTAYSTSAVGGSGYFDRSGDWLSTPSNAAFTFGTGDYTVECWFYPLVADGTNQSMWSTNWGASGSLLMTYDHPAAGSKKFGLFDYTINSGAPTLTSSSAFPINQWNHVVIARSGTTVKMFVNGSEQASATQSTNLTRDVFAVSSVYSGSATETSYGYISGFRVVKGTAVYTAAFTPPTAPPTAITNTSLLLNMTNAGIYDSAAKNDLETVGNAQVSTTQAKWGTTSMYFNGTTGYLKPYYPAPTNGTNFTFGTGDFTVEFWMYPTSAPANGMIMDGRGSGATGDLWLINWVNGVISWYAGATLISSSTVSTNTWTHVAICRSGTSTKMFLNGTQTGSTYTDTKNYTVGNGWPTIGASYNAVDFFTGYLDDVRVTKYARYTTNFTAPTAAFPIQ